MIRVNCLKLALGAIMTLAVAAAGRDYSVCLKVLDRNEKPVPEFEVMVHTHDEGSIPWKTGKDGQILLRSRSGHFPLFGRARRYQIIVRAAGFAPAIIEMDRPEGDIEQTAKLTKGQCIELVLTAENGRAIPETLEPTVVFPDFQKRVWLSFQHQGRHELDLNFTSLARLRPGHYRFYISEDSPEIYVFLDHPGFIRAFRAGPFGKEKLADGKLEIELPKPAELGIVVKPPKELLEKLPYGVWSVDITRQSPDDDTTGYPLAFIESGQLDMRIDEDFLAPGGYWVMFQTRPADRSAGYEWGRVNPAYFRDMKRYSLAPGQVEEVVFQYTAYHKSSYKGDYDATVSVRWHSGKTAANVPYTLYYEDRHFGSIVIEEGTIPDNGRLELTGLRGGQDAAHFTLELGKAELGRYLFQLTGQGKTRELEYRIGPQKDDVAPDITVVDVFTKEQIRLSDYRGKVLFVEFWATWCGPCQRPMAQLCEIASRRKADWADKAIALCISVDDKKEYVTSYVRGRGWLGVRHVWCEQGGPGLKSVAAKTYGIGGVPTALLIDQSGRIVWRGHPESVDVEAEIDELLSIR